MWAHLQLTLLALSKVMKLWLQALVDVVCNVLIYHSVKKSHAAAPAQMVLWEPTPSTTMKAWRLMMWVQTTMISCTTCYYNTHFSLHTLSTQPAMPVSTKQCEVLTRWHRVYFLCIESIRKLIQIFHSENLINSSYKTMAWRDQVLDASFSGFLSEIQFSMWNQLTKNIVKQNCSNEYLRHCNIDFVE